MVKLILLGNLVILHCTFNTVIVPLLNVLALYCYHIWLFGFLLLNLKNIYTLNGLAF